MPGTRALERVEADSISRPWLSPKPGFLVAFGPLLCALPAASHASGAARAASCPQTFIKYAGDPVTGASGFGWNNHDNMNADASRKVLS
jgi:hypothetical protein